MLNDVDPDTDNDGIPNTTDTDDDGDGTPDATDTTSARTGMLVTWTVMASRIQRILTWTVTASTTSMIRMWTVTAFQTRPIPTMTGDGTPDATDTAQPNDADGILVRRATTMVTPRLDASDFDLDGDGLANNVGP